MLRFVSHPLDDGETAVLYRDGDDTLVIINSHITDGQRRTDAVNSLLDRATPPLSAAV